MTEPEQYFTNNPTSKHDIKRWSFSLLDNKLEFITDAGVFSKSRVDFGTVLMIEATKNMDFIEGPILDLGTGYGPVGIALAKCGYQVTMSDVNRRALELVQKNTELNQIQHSVEIIESDIYSKINGQFAAVLVNPPIRAGKPIITQMIEQAPQYLLMGGKFIFVVQKKQGADSYKKIAEKTFGNIELIARDKGYQVFLSTKS